MLVLMLISLIKCCAYFTSGITDLSNEHKNSTNHHLVSPVMYSMCNFTLHMCIHVATVNNFVLVHANSKVQVDQLLLMIVFLAANNHKIL